MNQNGVLRVYIKEKVMHIPCVDGIWKNSIQDIENTMTKYGIVFSNVPVNELDYVKMWSLIRSKTIAVNHSSVEIIYEQDHALWKDIVRRQADGHVTRIMMHQPELMRWPNPKLIWCPDMTIENNEIKMGRIAGEENYNLDFVSDFQLL